MIPDVLSTEKTDPTNAKRPSNKNVLPDSSWISEKPLQAGSKRSSEVAEIAALVRETENVSLRQLRLERQSWRADRIELEHLRKLVDRENPISSETQLKALIQEKAEQEEQLESFEDEIMKLKEKVHLLQVENGELQRTSMKAQSQSDEAKRIKDLEQQISKWETLYFESAEIGEKQMVKVELELQQLREQLSNSEKGAEIDRELETEKETKKNGQDAHETSEHEDDEMDDAYSSDGSDDDELEQYVAELEHLLATQQEEAGKAKLQLEKSHNVGKEMQSRLKEERIKVQEAEEELAASKKREADLLEKMENAEIAGQHRIKMLEYQLDEVMTKLMTKSEEKSTDDFCTDDISDIRKYVVALQEELRVASEELEQSRAQVQALSFDQDVSSPVSTPVPIENDEFQESLAAYLVGTSMENCTDPLQVIETQQKELYESERKLETALKENQQLRKLKDSLMGIDEEMEVLIGSLEPIQLELAEKKEKAEAAMLEAASLRNLLNKESAAKDELEQEKRNLSKELVNVQGSLDKLHRKLKDEQAEREEEMNLMKIQAEGLKESLKHQMERYSELREKMDEIHEQQQMLT